jgi:hypothetical protein
LEATVSDFTWIIFACAAAFAFFWREHREKKGKKVSWLRDLLVVGGVAFAANFIVAFGETFIPAFTRSFAEGYRRTSGGATPSTAAAYIFLAALVLIPAFLVTVVVVGLRYIWKSRKLRQSNKTTTAGL